MSETSRKPARPVVRGLLERHADIDAIWCFNDYTALGAASELGIRGLPIRSGERPGVILSGIGGIPAAIDAIWKGQMTFTFDSQPVAAGRAAIDVLEQILLRKEKPQSEVWVDFSRFDLSNIGDHVPWKIASSRQSNPSLLRNLVPPVRIWDTSNAEISFISRRRHARQSVFLDTEGTVAKVCSLISEAASNGAKLIAFPEAFVPAFPLWSAVRAPIFNHDFFRRLAANAVHVPGPEIQRIAQVAKKHEVIVSLGINEGTTASVGCIWNSNIIIGHDGRLLNHHRKIMPTYFEKMAVGQRRRRGPERSSIRHSEGSAC